MSQSCIQLCDNLSSALQGESDLRAAGMHGAYDEYFSVILINGLYKYRMSPPIAPIGKSVTAGTRRLSIICRPPTAVVDGTSQVAFCVLPGDKRLDILPEFINPR